MAYATEADLEKRISPAELTELADDDGDGARDASVVADAIADADAEIDGYIAKHYAVPLASAPGLVRKLSADLAIYNLYVRRGVDSEQKRARYDDAITLLRLIADGKATLGAAVEPPKSAAAGGQFDANERRFTRDSLKDM